METLVLALDLIGTFLFALSGAMAAVRHRLDVFRVLVLAFTASNAGGIIRNLLIGAVPPAAIGDWRYVVASVVAGLITFWGHRTIHRIRDAVLVFDALGLAVFAVSGTLKALAFGADPLAAVLLGMLTGIGGGVLRDVLVGQIPIVLRAELYAVAAIAGASVVVIASSWRSGSCRSPSSALPSASDCALWPCDRDGSSRSHGHTSPALRTITPCKRRTAIRDRLDPPLSSDGDIPS